MSTDAAPPGWYADPMGRHEHRWFDGQRWTDQVSDGGVPSLDPLAGGGAPSQETARAEPFTASEPSPEHTVPLQPSHAQYGPPPAQGAIPPVPPGHPGAGGSGGATGGRKWLPWAILGVIVLVGVVAAVVLLGGDDDDGDDEVATTETTEAEDVAEDGSDTTDADDGGTDTTATTAATTTSAAAGRDYPQVVVDAFMNACTSGGTGADVCQCSLDALEERYTLEEFTELEQQMEGTTLPDEVLSVIEGCF